MEKSNEQKQKKTDNTECPYLKYTIRHRIVFSDAKKATKKYLSIFLVIIIFDIQIPAILQERQGRPSKA